MVTSLLIVSLLLGNTSERGETPSVAEQRLATRVRLLLGGGASFAAGPVRLIVPSFRFEVGAMMNDRFAVGGLLDVGTLVFGASTLVIGANVMWATTDWLALGTGLAVSHLGATGWEEYPAGQALLVPLRVDVSLPVRGARAVSRRGVALTAMIAPGVLRLSSPGLPRRGEQGAFVFQLFASVGLAYASW